MSATIAAFDYKNSVSFPVLHLVSTELVTVKSNDLSMVPSPPVTGQLGTTTLTAGFANHFDLTMPTIVINEIKAIAMNTSAPLTLGWAFTIAVGILLGVLSIAGGTIALIHSDVNDVRADLKDVRGDASADTADLRKDMRQDFSTINQKLDNMSVMLNDIRIEQAKKQ
ncbi:hypothetical protein QM100_09375 [Enterobacter asburiae]|uniref:hypothetical protein n=1 Tax=Enterobacter asburiae TaxID=61645 RepID=UPI0029495806|nr:hypothetical protein [Enterobacter asburiae]MDV5192611.1 hypothetical protein [Enterobacter asburiae]MDV5268812.1 hypothetical protein [Enterobacter asburiae]